MRIIRTVVAALVVAISACAPVHRVSIIQGSRGPVLCTILPGNSAADLAMSRRFHESGGPLAVTWFGLGEVQDCASPGWKEALDQSAAAAARWVQTFPKAAAGMPREIHVYLVPPSVGTTLRAEISTDHPLELAHWATCPSLQESASEVLSIAVHELFHLAHHMGDFRGSSSEAAAYTVQFCARLEGSGSLPPATAMNSDLPEELLADFGRSAPRDFMDKVKGANTSGLGAILAQLNIGLFTQNASLTYSTAAGADLVNYCECIARHHPDFELLKPGQLWRASRRCT